MNNDNNNKLNILIYLSEKFNISYNIIINIFSYSDNINMINNNNNIINDNKNNIISNNKNNNKLIFHLLTNNKPHIKKEAWVIIIISNNILNNSTTTTCNIMTKLYTDVGTQDINFYYNQDIFREGLHLLINFFELSNDDVDMPDADDNFIDMVVT
jgi:hypothetical protein